MKIISWNVNGYRAILKKGFNDFLKLKQPDILAIQEIKMGQNVIEKENFSHENYELYWNPAVRPGYSGTAVFVKRDIEVISASNKLGKDEFDNEGRTQILEFEKFFFINSYFPNANHELSRLDYKSGYNELFLKKVKILEKKKPVITCGDYNVAHEEIDLARPKENVGCPGFTYEERDWMSKFISSGLVDTYRHIHPSKQEYTWWSYRAGARTKNVGWRIDYFLTSKKNINKIKKSYILGGVLGSDHCPVVVEI